MSLSTEPSQLLDDIFIVIVLFQQTLLECPSYLSLTNALGDGEKFPTLMVYDNSPSVSNSNPKIHYIHNTSNPGVSKAYNEGYKIARALNKKWLLLADQDTEFSETIFMDYYKAINRYPEINLFVPSLSDSKSLLSPFKLLRGKGRRIKALDAGAYSIEKIKIINSGMLISLNSFEKAGGYDEQFPLDYSDISFASRVSKVDPHFVLLQSRCFQHFSATAKVFNKVSELARFESFCEASRAYKRSIDHSAILSWIILPRALKLSIQMKTFKFIKIGLAHIYAN